MKQGSLACCSSWEELDTTERLNDKIFCKKSQFIRKRENQGWDDIEA